MYTVLTMQSRPVLHLNQFPVGVCVFLCVFLRVLSAKNSDVDIEVEEGTGDEEYLDLLSDRLPYVIDQVRPDLIFYQVRGCPGERPYRSCVRKLEVVACWLYLIIF